MLLWIVRYVENSNLPLSLLICKTVYLNIINSCNYDSDTLGNDAMLNIGVILNWEYLNISCYTESKAYVTLLHWFTILF